MVELSSIQEVPSNVIIGIDGPTVTNFAGYEIYDWIKSEQSGYIDLGEQPTIGARMELTFMIDGDEDVIIPAQYLAGSRSSDNVRWFALSGKKDDTLSGFRICIAGKDRDITSIPRIRGKKYCFSGSILQNGSGYIYGSASLENLTDGTSASTNVPVSTYTAIPNTLPNIHIFHEPGGNYHKGMKCYRVKYYTKN